MTNHILHLNQVQIFFSSPSFIIAIIGEEEFILDQISYSEQDFSKYFIIVRDRWLMVRVVLPIQDSPVNMRSVNYLRDSKVMKIPELYKFTFLIQRKTKYL